MRQIMFIVLSLVFALEYTTAQERVGQKMMPVDPYDKKGKTHLHKQLTSLGFNVRSMQKVGTNRWKVAINGWQSTDMSQKNRGMIGFSQSKMGTKTCLASPCAKDKSSVKSWDPTDKRKKRAVGTLNVEINSNGLITFSKTNLKALGLKANSDKMQGKFSVR